MSWYYEQEGQPVGPISEEEFQRLATSGVVAPSTLIWREGMADWQAHAVVYAAPGVSVPPPAVIGTSLAPAVGGTALVSAAANVKCQVCGGIFPASEVVPIAGLTVCAKCKPIRLQMLQEGDASLPGGVWRSGRSLVMSRGAVLPERCVHCNGTADLRRLKRVLYWHHPAVYLAILVNLIVYAIIAMIVRKRVPTELSICRADLVRRRIKIAFSWVLLLAVPISIGFLVAYKVENWLWVIPPVFLIAAIVASMLSRLVYASKIDEKHIWVRGVCAPFLAELPNWTGQ